MDNEKELLELAKTLEKGIMIDQLEPPPLDLCPHLTFKGPFYYCDTGEQCSANSCRFDRATWMEFSVILFHDILTGGKRKMEKLDTMVS